MNNQNIKNRPNGNRFPNGTPIPMGTTQRSPAINNPYTKNHSIPVTIRRHFTDVNGTVINKATVPAALQVEYPFYVFGEFDRQGGYNSGLQALAPVNGTHYLLSFIQGNGFITSFLTGGFSGANTIKELVSVGDIVHVYTDDTQNPTYFIWIVQHFGQRALGAVVANSDSSQRDGLINKIFLESFKYHSDNVRQFDYPFYFIRSTNIATYKTDQVQPMIYKDPFVQQAELLEVEVNFNLDQYLSVGQYFLFATDIITMNFKLLE